MTMATDNEGFSRDLGRFEGKLDVVIDLFKGQTTINNSHDLRLKALEEWKSKATAVIATIVAGGAGIWTLVKLIVPYVLKP